MSKNDKKKYSFVPGLGMVSNQRTYEKEILSLVSSLRLSYYKKYLISLFSTLNDKALTGFKKNLQNKNITQVEYVICKYLEIQKIDFIPKPKNDSQGSIPKDKIKLAVSKHREKTKRKPYTVLLTDKTKNDLITLKKEYKQKTMEDLLLVLMTQHEKLHFFRFNNAFY